MYVVLPEYAVKQIKRITCNDYELVGCKLPVSSVVSLIEDLLSELDRAEEKYNDLEQNLEDNYKPISRAEMYGFDERDFY